MLGRFAALAAAGHVMRDHSFAARAALCREKRSTAAGRPYFAEVLKTGKFTVGEFAIGRQTGRNVLHFALPFYGDDAQLGGVVIAALGLDWLAGSIAQQDVPPGASLAIMDRNGTYLARYPDNARFVSRRIPGDSDRKPDHRSTADIVDLDGVERIVGYSILQDGGIVIAFGLDKAQAFTEIQHGTQRGVFLIVLSTALVLSLTSLGARRFIHRPLGQLVDAANQWRLGELARRVDIQGTSEIVRVAEAFNTMADALERREHELSEAKERAEEAAARFTMIFESTTDSVLIVDRDWRVSYLNGPASTSVAHGRDIVGMALSEAFPVAADLEAFEAEEQKPISIDYRGFTVLEAPPNSTGFVLLKELKILEQFDLAGLGLLSARPRSSHDDERG